ncbi:hypothetical protein LTR37_000357 [Vermiconidia calcicola]|uniref:Uncharacterized protein n=1 Tax=Vermiconidia calcicola TaxID=1690605 RepID=A0ACC3NZZ3_9PEZI|nr:hypothetical protein LTR37_000357 [Vermiconidia calcicola]
MTSHPKLQSTPQESNAPPANPFLNGRKPLKIVIIGGSCAALFAAILLKRQGHNIRILESAPSSSREGLAAGIGLAAHVKRFFDEHDRLKDIPFGTPNDTINFLDAEMQVRQKVPVGLIMTTWDATYYRLRANFDGLRSPYCAEPPTIEEGEGEEVFETGKRATVVEEVVDGLSVVVEDVGTNEQLRHEADMVIAADGANSTMRRQLEPQLQRAEPGYVIWRGTVPTADLSQELLDKIEGHTIFYPMQHSYAVIYTIPGENGTLAPGSRHINFAWYFWPTPSVPTSAILTDIHNHQHRTTLPKGLMRPEIWSAQLSTAREMFNPLLYSLISQIKEPFVSVISSVMSPRARYMNDRLFLIGDALAQVQPNTGQGTNLAALDAMLLADVVKGDLSAEEWEKRVLEVSQEESAKAKGFAKQWLGELNPSSG